MDRRQLQKELILCELVKDALAQYGTRTQERMQGLDTAPAQAQSPALGMGTRTQERIATATATPKAGTKWSGYGQTPHPALQPVSQSGQQGGLGTAAARLGKQAEHAYDVGEQKVVGSLKRTFPTFTRWAGARPYGYGPGEEWKPKAKRAPASRYGGGV